MIISFLSVFVILGILPNETLGQFRCPYSCVCSEETEEMRCIGTPQLEIISILRNAHPKRFRWVYIESYNIKNLTSRHVDIVVPWLRSDISNQNGLSLQRNKIYNIEDNTFRHLELYRLERLQLAHNRLTVLRRAMFTGLSKIRELFLNHNKIYRINSDAFRELKQLESIYLDSNQIVDIAAETFSYNVLRSLYISDNKLRALGNSILLPGQKLTHLDASNNSIQQFSFSRFQNTFSLNLNDNLLACIDFGAFFSFTDGVAQSSDSDIHLRHNKIQRIIPPQQCRTSLQHKQTVNTRIDMNDNLIPETFSPLSVFPCANGHVKNNISGKIVLKLERNCFCRATFERVGGLEIQAYSANCKYISLCPREDPHLPNACSGGFRNNPDPTLIPQPTKRGTSPTPGTTKTTTVTTHTIPVSPNVWKPTQIVETTEATTTTETTETAGTSSVLVLREPVLYTIAASGVVSFVIIVITIVVCCCKKRQKAQVRQESIRQQLSETDANNKRQPQYQPHNKNRPQLPTYTTPPNLYEHSFSSGGNPNLQRAVSEGHLHHQDPGQQLSASTPALDTSEGRSDYTYMYLDTDQMGGVAPHVPYDNVNKLRGPNNLSNSRMHVVQ